MKRGVGGGGGNEERSGGGGVKGDDDKSCRCGMGWEIHRAMVEQRKDNYMAQSRRRVITLKNEQQQRSDPCSRIPQ